MLHDWCITSAYMYRVVIHSREGKTSNFSLMCTLFRINAVLRIKIDQLEEKLEAIKTVDWLNLSVESVISHYKAQIVSKQSQYNSNRSAADQILVTALQN